jgi:hypothetical protein
MWSGVRHPGKYSSAPEPGGFWFSTTSVCRQASKGKTRGINSILYKEYESVLFIIIVISYLVLFFWTIP